MIRQRTTISGLLCLSVGLVALSACATGAQSATGDDASAASDTVAMSGLPGSTPTVTTLSSPTTVGSTIATSTTRPAPSTTTTELPTTTAAPTTTLAPNVELVGVAPIPVEAVGGSNGERTKIVQMRLLQLGFWNGGADGDYGHTTTQAVMAFQKYLGLDPSGKVDETTASWLTHFPERAHGVSDTGTLVEIDKARQLLFIVVDGKTLWTFNTSTGSGKAYEATNKKDPTKIEKGDAITPNGLWKTNRERPEGWWEGDLGEIYRPKYFKGGIAIHGMTSIPNYPASHGCVRLSVPAMDFIWETGLIPLRTTVWVHG